ncbi:hypothetical protein LTR17_025027 [Elasticomyces elasticus]|nr:hypothetical protein LTR17_025027 [Elasticomyces elasticus]
MQSTIATFSALFYDHKEFASKAAAATFLATDQSGEDDVIVDTLRFWTDELLTRDGLDNVILKHNITIIHLPALVQSHGVYKTYAMTNLQQCTHRIVVAELAQAAENEEGNTIWKKRTSQKDLSASRRARAH